MSTDAFNQSDYARLEGARMVSATQTHVTFDCSGIPVAVSAHLPGVLRVTVGKTGRPDYGLLTVAEPQGRIACESTEFGFRLVSGELVLEVGASPLRIALSQRSKSRVTSITDQHFRGRSRVPAFGRDATKGKWCMGLALDSETALYGFGEKFGPLDKRGQLIRGRIEDALGVNTELSYKNIPFFWTSDGWGALIHSTGTVRHGAGYPQWSHRSYIAEVEDDHLDVFLFAGEPAQILDAYTQLTGRPAEPPLWGYGMWLSRAYYKVPQEAIDAAAQLRKLRVPCDVITLDGRAAWEVRTRFAFEWDKSRFDNPKQTMDALKSHNLKVCVWEYPYVSIHNPLFAELESKGWLLKNKDGKAYVFDWVKDPTDDPFGKVLTPLPPSGILDFTHPDAAKFWADSHNKLFDDGVDVLKTDFGEQVEDDMVASNGDTGRALHNVYPLLYNRTVFEATQRYNDAHGKGAAMVWGRDGFIGSQRYPMQWGGDPQTDWEAMAASIRAGLGYGMSGVPYYATDVGGFYGATQPDAELYLRWTANAIFSSHFRYHGIGEREPWAFGDAALDTAKRLLALRYRLIPYIAGCAEQAARTGLPLMRAMPLACPNDRFARGFETQYLFGDALLVAPIFRPGGEVDVYFPTGETWFDFFTGERMDGGQVKRVAKPIDQLPVYGRGGHALALGRAVQHTGEIDLANPVEELRLFGLPRQAPVVLGGVLLFEARGREVNIGGVTSHQCRATPGVEVRDMGDRRVLVRES
ncbi:MAG: glycoside hydrolase family 31 protein [Betaproteobacteria bacterium]|nr:glycoside hydrolase family 31 protein [Betaproteobacteria bacterium]